MPILGDRRTIPGSLSHPCRQASESEGGGDLSLGPGEVLTQIKVEAGSGPERSAWKSDWQQYDIGRECRARALDPPELCGYLLLCKRW